MYQWPLALALLLLGIEVLIPGRSRDRSGAPPAGTPPE
jgi:hypothetical protein